MNTIVDQFYFPVNSTAAGLKLSDDSNIIEASNANVTPIYGGYTAFIFNVISNLVIINS